jgi:hypothetical protein
MSNTALASAVEPWFTSVDFLLITFWACLLFLCIAILHLLVPLWRLLDGRAPLQLRVVLGEPVDRARIRLAFGPTGLSSGECRSLLDGYQLWFRF